jgi:hypothetical protein
MFSHYFSHELKEDEEILMVVRKHWFTFARPGIKIVVILLVPFILAPFLLSSMIGAIVFLSLMLAGIVYAAYEFINWYLDTFIITNIRIIDIDQHGLFRRTVSEAELANIQDVTYSVNGFFPTLLNFGTCSIQTAGAKNVIEMENVHQPHALQEELLRIRRQSAGATGKGKEESEKASSEELSARELITLLEQKQQTPESGVRKHGSVIDLSDKRHKPR